MDEPMTTGRRCATAMLGLMVVTACAGGGDDDSSARGPQSPAFEPVQSELFSADGAQPNAWADYDADGDLDLFVGFRGRPNRLYRNDRGTFVDVAGAAGLADDADTRAAAWGDWDADGDPDLYVGFAASASLPNRIYRNDGGSFVDVAAELGVRIVGESRQPAFVDYDGDGDLDLFVGLRDQANRLYRNDGGRFLDVTEESGLGDPRRTVGAAWFDMDDDGDPDLFVANQNGDEDAFYRNDGGRFRDVAPELGMNQPGRSEEQGSVGVAVADADGDGDLDVFVASYGPDVLWLNRGDGTWENAARGGALAGDHHSVAAAWGDLDNDGLPDLYVGTFLSGQPQVPDQLFRNLGSGRFEDVTPVPMLGEGASHGVSWADYDLDGDLDLALANNDAQGTHPLYRNLLPPDRAARGLEIAVLDGEGRWLRAGATVAVAAEAAPPDGAVPFRSARVVTPGGGYSSQDAAPVHFGVPSNVSTVSVTVTWFERGERRTATVSGVDPLRFSGRWLTLRLGVQ